MPALLYQSYCNELLVTNQVLGSRKTIQNNLNEFLFYKRQLINKKMFVLVTTTEHGMVHVMRRAFFIVDEQSKAPFKETEAMDDLLSIDEAAKFLKVSKATIHNWRKQGIISCLRKGGRV